MAVKEPAAVAVGRVGEPAFGAADLVWEQVEEAAVRAYRSGGADAALLHWRRGLSVAVRHFEGSDPRLGTALTNHAFALRRSGDQGAAVEHFRHAEKVFFLSGRWLDRMFPADRPGEVFDEAAKDLLRKLLGRARATARAIQLDDQIPLGAFEQWRRERPNQPGEVRKLLASALLFVSRAG